MIQNIENVSKPEFIHLLPTSFDPNESSSRQQFLNFLFLKLYLNACNYLSFHIKTDRKLRLYKS